MDEYIDKKTIIKLIDDTLLHEDKLQCVEKETLLAVKRWVNAVKSASVRPVVKGEWLKTKQESICQLPTFYYVYECSVCGHRPAEGLYNFCPICGAYMKGE